MIIPIEDYQSFGSIEFSILSILNKIKQRMPLC